ncbi:hypothetical protein [Rhodococcus spongiicola]|nr:hypothetical protein [Rhodococcus spongiicola]
MKVAGIGAHGINTTFEPKNTYADAATWLPPNKSYRCIYVSRHP